ncbi:MAG: nucleoside hydrolase [Nocardioidaceae bacterium]|nr:nucleoside hydrolase [Nocardioidaceae bacterium]
MVRIHLDTDFAGDPDDACALAMLLGWPGVDMAGITTVADPDGRRAGYVHRLLEMAGSPDIPVVSGAGASLTTGLAMGSLPDHDRYWGDDPVTPVVSPSGAATGLLRRSVASGATVVAIGPQTNLAMLELDQPGVLTHVQVVAMGGWFGPPADGLPDWGPTHDWNTQRDTRAAATVADRAQLTLVPLSVTVGVHLTRRDLPRLEAAGPLGRVLARQALAYCEDESKSALAADHPGLPTDLLNFHHDPLACAVAAGWSGASRRPLHLAPHLDNGILSFVESAGRPVSVVTAVDSSAFARRWLAAVEHCSRLP